MSDHELTQAYYDGELDAGAEARALTHLASCEACQRDLADWMQLDGAALGPATNARRAAPRATEASTVGDAGQPPSPIPVPAVRSRARRWLPGLALAAAAAAAAVLILRPARKPRPDAAPALALADTRAVEFRVADPALDRHRPYGALRGTAAGELLPMAAVAALEGRAPSTYTGALLLSGDARRAEASLAAVTDAVTRAVDRSALALLRGDAIGALEATDLLDRSAPTSQAARWNRALALRALDLPRAAAAAFDAVAAAGEPGWSDEARSRAAALRQPVEEAEAALTATTNAGAAMKRGGPAIEPALARRFPAQARLDLHDALRVATTPADVERLRPVAAAIDEATGGDGATRWIDKLAASDLAVRARFAPRYREVMDQALRGPALDRFLDELRRAGTAVADVRIGALILSGAWQQRLDEVEDAAAATGDPWFTTFAVRRRADRRITDGDRQGAEASLRPAVARCPAELPYRCGGLEATLADLLVDGHRLDEAARHATAARHLFASAGGPSSDLSRALRTLAEIERLRGRFAAMAAYFAEYRARDSNCAISTYVDEALATAAYWQDDIERARRLLPDADACNRAPSPVLVMLGVDVARLTGSELDRAFASRVLDGVRSTNDPAQQWLADLGLGRLQLAIDPAAGRATIAATLAAPPAGLPPTNLAEGRAWAYSSLIGDAADHDDHARVLDLLLEELGRPAIDGCVLGVSLDDDRWATVARTADGALLGAHGRSAGVLKYDADAAVPPALRAALARCPRIAVIARPPLHGRSDLLPANLPWAFVGPTAARPSRPTSGGAVIIRDVRPPADLDLPAIGATAVEAPGDRTLLGADATPSRVLAAMADAGYVEVHAHGLVGHGPADTSLVALSAEPDGRFALTGADVQGARLNGSPVVVLAACRSATVAPILGARWSLPDAFLQAGAGAVIAAASAIPDDDAVAFSTSLRARLVRGESPEAAVAAERTAPGGAWRQQLMVFR
jgi:cellulose synthase operon protein C